jgi:ABC-type phosphate/phosphonate transport system substrate-binding protein
MPRASLAMYDMLAPVKAANDRLWGGIRERLLSSGLDAPEELDRTTYYHDVWSMPDLLLSQTCGYPYVTELRGKVRLVATPVYDFPGGNGAERCSVIIVSDNDARPALVSYRGARAAINDWRSNSGMNLFRAAIAPLSGGKPFFSSISVAGGHLGSITAVREGRADIAAIDSVTWGLLARHAPEKLQGVRILEETPYGPGLPLIANGGASDAALGVIVTSVTDAIADPALADSIAVLGLTGVAVLSDDDYLRLDRLRQEAEALGYPTLA